MSNKKETLEGRRNFLKTAITGSAVGLVSTATLAQAAASPAESCAKPSWEVVPAPIPDSQIKETVVVDIVVIGAGVAGLSTTLAAAEAGAKVALIEKGKTFSARGYANGCINSKLHKKKGIVVDKERVVGELIAWASNRVNQKLIRQWADHSGEVIDYYIDLAEKHGLEAMLDDECFKISPYYTEHTTAVSFKGKEDTGWFYEGRIAGVIEQEAKKFGANVQYGCYAQQLVREKNGRVSGVIVKQGGALKKFVANKAMILTTGDYASNPEMVNAWCPIMNKADANVYTPPGANMGEGIKMAIWIGANIQDTPHPPMFHVIPGVGCDLMASNQTNLIINTRGQRYENEAQPLQGICDGRFGQPGNKTWGVFDSSYEANLNTLEKAPFGPICEPQSMLDKSVEQKLALKADTIEGLAAQLGVPAANLKKTVERYNELAKKGVDEDYGKPKRLMFAIDKAPFYAVMIPVHKMVVVGGLDVDENSQVLDKQGEAIPGLFAIGNVAGNMFANDYPLTAPGLSHGRCLTIGRLVGQKLAKG